MASTLQAPGVFGSVGRLPWKFKIPLFLGAIILFFLVATALLNLFNYSVGQRTGVIGKLSRKGVACWTTEGQLALPNFAQSGALRGSGPAVDNTFYFSVPDPDVRKQIEALPDGSPVTLEYHQKLFALDWPIPFFCRRRTQYEIVGVRVAPAFPPTMPARP
jgi:hypothetical protein